MTAHPPVSHLPPDAQGVRKLEFRALGTACSVQFRQPDERAALVFVAEAMGWLEGFEAKFSRFRPDSLISRINVAAGKDWVAVDAEMERILDVAEGLHRITEGVIDATMLPLLQVWDWKKARERLPETSDIHAAFKLTGWRKVRRRTGAVFLPETGMGLDFGGFGKEFAVDRLALLARAHGITDALVDLGRDIFALGGNGRHPFWHVGLEDGNKPGTCWGGLAVSDRAVAASGDYARCFVHQGVRYGHIIDARTGWPASKGIRAVTVIAPTCLEAGVYSTSVCVLGREDGFNLASRARHVEVCLQDERGVQTSPGFARFQVKAA